MNNPLAKPKLIGKQWLPVIAWMVVIFLFSSQAHSGAITEKYLGSFNIPVRKLCHLSEYFLLFLLAHRAFRLSGDGFSSKAMIFALTLSLFYAGTDEWHQSFVPGRSASVADVLVDFLGSLLASALVALKGGFTVLKP